MFTPWSRDGVMSVNMSWPDMSHKNSSTVVFEPSMGTDATARSIPEVVLWLFGKAPDVNICQCRLPDAAISQHSDFALSTTPPDTCHRLGARPSPQALAYMSAVVTRPSLLDDFS